MIFCCSKQIKLCNLNSNSLSLTLYKKYILKTALCNLKSYNILKCNQQGKLKILQKKIETFLQVNYKKINVKINYSFDKILKINLNDLNYSNVNLVYIK